MLLRDRPLAESPVVAMKALVTVMKVRTTPPSLVLFFFVKDARHGHEARTPPPPPSLSFSSRPRTLVTVMNVRTPPPPAPPFVIFLFQTY